MAFESRQSSDAAHNEAPEISLSEPGIPTALVTIANVINACPDTDRRLGLPLRSWMHSKVPGVLDCRNRILRKTHPLAQHVGDLRLFSHRMWAWICYPGPAAEPGEGRYEATYNARFTVSKRNNSDTTPIPAHPGLKVPAHATGSGSPLQHGIQGLQHPTNVRSRGQRSGRTKRSARSILTSREHVHVEVPCMFPDCQTRICIHCPQRHYADLTDAQRSALELGALMPLCPSCQDAAGEVRDLHCECSGLRSNAQICLTHLRLTLSCIVEIKTQYFAEHRWANTRFMGGLRRLLRCPCKQIICEAKDNIRRCCVCGLMVNLRHASHGEHGLIKYSAGVEPFTI